MEAAKRRVESGSEYDHLFPRSKGTTRMVKRDANVSDTVHFIPKVVRQTLHQTERILPEVKGKTLYETCEKIWWFVYDHITYEKDAHGVEQIRSPARSWADRRQGVDCDCYTTFISSILTNLKIPHLYRITKYGEDRFQHIYPVVKAESGKEIIIDCVVKDFDYEKPYSEKKDYIMDLEYLDGINDDEQLFEQLSEEAVDELGKIKIFAKIGTAVKKAVAPLKKVANVVNKVNPAAVLLRTGLLASMKLNLMKVAGKLRWAYLSEAQAQQKGMIVDKHRKLVTIRTKLENIFYTAGGKPENLKNAILTGKGNQDKQVLAGLGDVEILIDEGISRYTPLSVLLGTDVYNDEYDEGLGEPVTAASITAASGALATIAALIKGIGELFPAGNKMNEAGEQEASPGESVDIPADTTPAASSSNSQSDTSLVTTDNGSSESTAAAASGEENKEGFWEKNKSWMKPTLWGVGGLAVLILGYKAVTSKEKPKPKPSVAGLEGTKGKVGRPPGKKNSKKKPVPLL